MGALLNNCQHYVDNYSYIAGYEALTATAEMDLLTGASEQLNIATAQHSKDLDEVKSLLCLILRQDD